MIAESFEYENSSYYLNDSCMRGAVKYPPSYAGKHKEHKKIVDTIQSFPRKICFSGQRFDSSDPNIIISFACSLCTIITRMSDFCFFPRHGILTKNIGATFIHIVFPIMQFDKTVSRD